MNLATFWTINTGNLWIFKTSSKLENTYTNIYFMHNQQFDQWRRWSLNSIENFIKRLICTRGFQSYPENLFPYGCRLSFYPSKMPHLICTCLISSPSSSINYQVCRRFGWNESLQPSQLFPDKIKEFWFTYLQEAQFMIESLFPCAIQDHPDHTPCWTLQHALCCTLLEFIVYW